MRIAVVVFTSDKSKERTGRTTDAVFYEYLVPEGDKPVAGDFVLTHSHLGGILQSIAQAKILKNTENKSSKAVAKYPKDDEEDEDIFEDDDPSFEDLLNNATTEEIRKRTIDYGTTLAKSLSSSDNLKDRVALNRKIAEGMAIGIVVDVKDKEFVNTRANKFYIALISNKLFKQRDRASIMPQTMAGKRSDVLAATKELIKKVTSSGVVNEELVRALASQYPELKSHLKIVEQLNSYDPKADGDFSPEDT